MSYNLTQKVSRVEKRTVYWEILRSLQPHQDINFDDSTCTIDYAAVVGGYFIGLMPGTGNT